MTPVDEPFAASALAGRTALVAPCDTDAARAVAALFVRLGARVAVPAAPHARDGRVALPAAVVRIPVAAGDAAGADAAGADALVAAAWAALGPLDTVVCAGDRGVRAGEATTIEVDDWRDAIRHGLDAVWFLMHAAARAWRDAGAPGAVVALIPPWRDDRVGAAPQRAAAAAVAHLAKTVAVEWAAHRVRVNCVAAEGDAPHRIAQAVAWLSAPSGKFVTGETVTLARPGAVPAVGTPP